MSRRLALLLLAALAATTARAQTLGSNGYYDVAVNATGEYTARTGPLHPNANLSVFYNGIIQSPGTTWNSVRSYDSGREWVLRTNVSNPSAGFTCDKISSLGAAVVTPLLDGSGNTTGVRLQWTISDRMDELTVTQEVNAEGTRFSDSVVRVTLCVRNDSTAADAHVGIRYLWDWQIAGVDGPFLGIRPPSPPAEPYLSREQDFPDPSFDDYDVSNTQDPSVNPPFYQVSGTVNAPPLVPPPTHPDLVQYVSWFDARQQCFDYATTGAIVGAPSGTDSGVTYYWGPSAASPITIAPGEEHCVTQYVFAFGSDPPPLCDITATVFGGVTCGGASATIDASPSSSSDCTGPLEYRFTDPFGVVQQDWSTTATYDASQQGTWTIDARCSTMTDCTDRTTTPVIIEHLPVLYTFDASDVLPCNTGIHLQWAAATWQDTNGGVYDLHRSEISCDDALAQAPIQSGIAWPPSGIEDSTTAAGASYYYVLVAENASPAYACLPVGPRGGAITTLCTGPVTERSDPMLPDYVCWPLRVSHAGDEVKLDWNRARFPLRTEHVHVLKSLGDPRALVLTSPEDYQGRTWIETDTTRVVQFFDVRYANECEIESKDDEPQGWDPPLGVPCP